MAFDNYIGGYKLQILTGAVMPTPTITPTRTITPTPTLSPTPTITPTITPTPTPSAIVSLGLEPDSDGNLCAGRIAGIDGVHYNLEAEMAAMEQAYPNQNIPPNFTPNAGPPAGTYLLDSRHYSSQGGEGAVFSIYFRSVGSWGSAGTDGSDGIEIVAPGCNFVDNETINIKLSHFGDRMLGLAI